MVWLLKVRTIYVIYNKKKQPYCGNLWTHIIINLLWQWNFYKFLPTKHWCFIITIPFLMESITFIMYTSGMTLKKNLNFQTVFIFMINTFSQKLFRMVSLPIIVKLQISNFKMALFAKINRRLLTVSCYRFQLLKLTKIWSSLSMIIIFTSPLSVKIVVLWITKRKFCFPNSPI